MVVKGKRKFPSIIDALVKLKSPAAASYPPTLRTDAACILEALVAEFDEATVLHALERQGLSAEAYRSTLRGLSTIAKERRVARALGD